MAARRALILMVPLVVLPSSTTAQQPNRDAGATNLQSFRGQIGQRLAFVCPPGQAAAQVYGTDVYTDNSSICAAAVHAGAISLDRGGPVTIRITEGRKAYQGSTRNGVVSREYGRWETSFEVLPARQALVAAPGVAPDRATVTTRAAPTAPILRAESPQPTTATAPNAARAGVAPRGELRPVASSTPGPAPAIVSATGFKGVAGPKYSQLSWNAAPGSVGYGLTRYDPTTQQRVTLRTPSGDTVFAQTGYTDTAVTPNRTYGYRLRTHFHDGNGELVSDPDTSQGVSVTPKDPNAPLALPPDFQDSVKIQFTLSPPDPNRHYPQKGDTTVTLSWDWRTGAQGYRIHVFPSGSMPYLVGANGAALHDVEIKNYSSLSQYVEPYASTRVKVPSVLRPNSSYLFCVFAASPVDPGTGRRVESRPGLLKLKHSNMSTGGKWVTEASTYVDGSLCPKAPADF